MFPVYSGVPRVLAAQGYLRSWDADGTIRRREWDDAQHVLGRVSVTVVSEEDIEGDLDLARGWARTAPVIVTIAERGAIVLRGGREVLVPGYPRAGAGADERSLVVHEIELVIRRTAGSHDAVVGLDRARQLEAGGSHVLKLVRVVAEHPGGMGERARALDGPLPPDRHTSAVGALMDGLTDLDVFNVTLTHSSSSTRRIGDSSPGRTMKA